MVDVDVNSSAREVAAPAGPEEQPSTPPAYGAPPPPQADSLQYRRRWVLVGAVLFVVAAAVLGADARDRLSPGSGFRAGSAESTLADRALEERFGAGPPNLVIVASTGGEPIGEAGEAGAELTARLASVAGVDDVVSYWSAGTDQLRSTDGTAALVLARIQGNEDEIDETFRLVEQELAEPIEGLRTAIGGTAAVAHETVHQSKVDLRRAELLAAPLVLLALLVVFRSIVASLLPLVIGVASVVGTLAVLAVATLVAPVSIFALNLTTALGFGLAVDYSLLFLTRYRAERRAMSDRPIARTIETAGRSILFSALTTAVSLACMAIFPLGFLRSMAVAGPAVVLLAAGLTLAVLPALVAFLGDNIERGALPGRRHHRPGVTRWRRVGMRIAERPGLVAVVVTAGLVLLAGPFLDVQWGRTDDRVHAPGSDARVAHDIIRSDFDGSEFGAVAVVLPDRGGLGDDAIGRIATDMSELDDVARVESPTGVYADGVRMAPREATGDRYQSGDSVWISVVPAVEPFSESGRDLVRAVRAMELPAERLVGGDVATQIDTVDAITERVPLAIAAVVVASLVLLGLLTRSVLVPVKAVVLNALSLTATLGAVVWIFQLGNLAGVLDFTPTGTIDLTIVVLIVAVSFGLAMDYEVFLVSRMREEYDHHGDNTEAVIASLEKTATVITASAALIAIVFGAFITADIALVKMSGLGIALAVVVDAVVIRSTLAPALMVMAGERNWWPHRRPR
ncbi:MAG: MMPL family transporter [Acidimicrobiales bacterium]